MVVFYLTSTLDRNYVRFMSGMEPIRDIRWLANFFDWTIRLHRCSQQTTLQETQIKKVLTGVNTMGQASDFLAIQIQKLISADLAQNINDKTANRVSRLAASELNNFPSMRAGLVRRASWWLR
jgi:hypothetical protein